MPPEEVQQKSGHQSRPPSAMQSERPGPRTTGPPNTRSDQRAPPKAKGANTKVRTTKGTDTTTGTTAKNKNKTKEKTHKETNKTPNAGKLAPRATKQGDTATPDPATNKQPVEAAQGPTKSPVAKQTTKKQKEKKPKTTKRNTKAGKQAPPATTQRRTTTPNPTTNKECKRRPGTR